MIIPQDKATTSAVKFTRAHCVSRSELTRTATALGLAHYQPFSEGQIYDDLLVGLEPYGIYTFTDNSQVHVVAMNGTFYVYISKDPSFKNPPPPSRRRPLGFRPVPNGRVHPKHDEPGSQPPAELQHLARRALEALRNE